MKHISLKKYLVLVLVMLLTASVAMTSCGGSKPEERQSNRSVSASEKAAEIAREKAAKAKANRESREKAKEEAAKKSTTQEQETSAEYYEEPQEQELSDNGSSSDSDNSSDNAESKSSSQKKKAKAKKKNKVWVDPVYETRTVKPNTGTRYCNGANSNGGCGASWHGSKDSTYDEWYEHWQDYVKKRTAEEAAKGNVYVCDHIHDDSKWVPDPEYTEEVLVKEGYWKEVD